MKHTITVFVENKPPVEVSVIPETTVADILKNLKVSGKCLYLSSSENKERPCSYISTSDTFFKETRFWETGYNPKNPTQFKGIKSLWVGFPPKKGETKYCYNWVGNDKIEKSTKEAYEMFEKYARYHERTNSYSIQGIEETDTGKLFDLWVKVRNFKLV